MMYDELAANYHLMFEDWNASIERQAAALAPILERECGLAANVRVLDCACGIGTQTLGLARSGFRMTASDISAAAVERAMREAAARGLQAQFYVANMLELGGVCASGFDAVICMDNALPHLESDENLLRALAQIRSKLREGGLLLASIRDYDRLVVERPVVHGPAFHSDAGKRRIVLQVWDWQDGRRYMFHIYITREADAGWETQHYASTYRAVLREELSGLIERAEFHQVRWLLPEESGFYQPMVIARTGTG